MALAFENLAAWQQQQVEAGLRDGPRAAKRLAQQAPHAVALRGGAELPGQHDAQPVAAAAVGQRHQQEQPALEAQPAPQQLLELAGRVQAVLRPQRRPPLRG